MMMIDDMRSEDKLMHTTDIHIHNTYIIMVMALPQALLASEV
jgi:hypothetical protein